LIDTNGISFFRSKNDCEIYRKSETTNIILQKPHGFKLMRRKILIFTANRIMYVYHWVVDAKNNMKNRAESTIPPDATFSK